MTPNKSAPRDSRAYDLFMASPLILLCGFGIAGFAILISRQLRLASPDIVLIGEDVVTATFLALQLALVCVRRLPVDKAQGIQPRAWAFAGAYFAFVIVLLPKESLSRAMAEVSTGIVVIGTLGSIVTLMWLRGAFAVLPQARMLVTTGPYAVVRHPLYVFEQLAMLGIAFQYRWPWGFAVAAASLALQFPRMAYEEKILTQTFAQYEDYARVTPRLIPYKFPPAPRGRGLGGGGIDAGRERE